MNPSSGMTGYINPLQVQVSHTDLVRFWVIVAFIVSIIGIAYVSMSAGYGTIVPQLFYIPIVYTAYFYPERSMYVACCCGVAYSFVAAFFAVPELYAMAGILFQALLFVVIAAAATVVLKHRETTTPAPPEDDAEAIRTMIRPEKTIIQNSNCWYCGAQISPGRKSWPLNLPKYGNTGIILQSSL